MNDTPRMKAAWVAPQRRGDGFVTTCPGDIAMNVMTEGKKLEIELAEMTRQRDLLLEALKSVAAHDGPGFPAGTCAEIAQAAIESIKKTTP